MSQKLFIVIEWVDHSGKTTLAKGLVEQLWAEYAYTPTPFHEVRHYMRNSSDTTRLLFYMMANHYFSDHFDEREADIVICDRYRYSTYTSHDTLPLDKHFYDSLRKPDLVIYTHADRDTIAQRTAESTKWTFWNEDLEFLKSVDQRMRNILPSNTLFINSSTLGKQECVDLVIGKINQLRSQ